MRIPESELQKNLKEAQEENERLKEKIKLLDFDLECFKMPIQKEMEHIVKRKKKTKR